MNETAGAASDASGALSCANRATVGATTVRHAGGAAVPERVPSSRAVRTARPLPPASRMFVDFELTPEDQRERLAEALVALGSLERSPQERIDRALSCFRRAFKEEPAAGPVRDAFRKIWVAVGDPPYGTWPGARLDTLTREEQDAIIAGLVAVYAAVLCEHARPSAPDAASDADALNR